MEATPALKQPDTLTYEQAVALLPEGDQVHTFRGGRGLMLGADWPLPSLLDALRQAPEIRLSGPMATSMGHGLAILEGGSWLFIATDRAALAALKD